MKGLLWGPQQRDTCFREPPENVERDLGLHKLPSRGRSDAQCFGGRRTSTRSLTSAGELQPPNAKRSTDGRLEDAMRCVYASSTTQGPPARTKLILLLDDAEPFLEAGSPFGERLGPLCHGRRSRCSDKELTIGAAKCEYGLSEYPDC